MTGIAREFILPTGTKISVDETRVRYDLPSSDAEGSAASYSAVSSAILNGGHQQTLKGPLRVLNYRVPSDYNGYDPSPQDLLSGFATREGLQKGQQTNASESNIIGLLTAASMKTFSNASRSYQGIHVDVIVTAGLSNSRAAGADADWFVLCEDEESSEDDTADAKSNENANGDDDGKHPIKPGTINTVVITNADLTPAALVEAYAMAIEAKCRACVDHSVGCAKTPSDAAQGTGTDCCVLISSSDGKRRVKHAGKHTLFAEMVGQAVYEATSESIMINIRYTHGSFPRYMLHRFAGLFWAILRGARPCIPPRPMMPVPNAPPPVLVMGILLTLASYLFISTESVSLLLGAIFWDRYLGEPPLLFHPVVIAGNIISATLSRVPQRVYQNGFLGFVSGTVLLLLMVTGFASLGWVFLQMTERLSEYAVQVVTLILPSFDLSSFVFPLFDFIGWVLRLLLVKSTFSIQLLVTLGLQMAKFLERKQLDDAKAQLCWLCSRDPSDLLAEELAGATLESLSENLSDGFVGPLFFYALFGPLGTLGYRIVNTLDSRIGYRGKYEYFGKASARFDDLLNILPARITTVLLASAAVFVKGCSGSDGMKTAISDRKKCESPNAGWPMACMAGLLGVKLEKKKEYSLGTGMQPTPLKLRVGCRVAQIAGGMAVGFFIVFLHFRN